MEENKAYHSVEPHDIIVGDLVLMEVLQGARDHAESGRLSDSLAEDGVVEIFGDETARATARKVGYCEARGSSLRRQIGLILGTYCLMHDHEILYRGKDFAPMVRHLGLRQAAGSGQPR